MKQQKDLLLRHIPVQLLEYGKLFILLGAAFITTFLIVDNPATADALFQSPASPVQESPAQQPPPAEQAPAQQPPPAEQAPAQQPPAEQAPAQQPPAEQAPAQEAIQSESPIAPESPQLSTINEPPPLPQPTPIPRTNSADQDDLLDEEAGSNFILDRVEMVDTVVVSGAYIWLCCGAIFLLLIPLAFLLLQIRGQIKIRREEEI